MNDKETSHLRFNLRLPKEEREWLAVQAKQNLTSANAEVIRCVRERMQRVTAGLAA